MNDREWIARQHELDLDAVIQVCGAAGIDAQDYETPAAMVEAAIEKVRRDATEELLDRILGKRRPA